MPRSSERHHNLKYPEYHLKGAPFEMTLSIIANNLSGSSKTILFLKVRKKGAYILPDQIQAFNSNTLAIAAELNIPGNNYIRQAYTFNKYHLSINNKHSVYFKFFLYIKKLIFSLLDKPVYIDIHFGFIKLYY